jgi:hypothetical protein
LTICQFGAIQIIRDTFLNPPPSLPGVTFVSSE